jgi:hypothetical protein
LNSANSQSSNELSVFHRLTLLNHKNELMVVKVEDAPFWVTPGLYLTPNQSIKHGLDSLAGTYGLTIENPKLSGLFILKREINGKKSTSLRHVFTAGVKGGSIKLPKGIQQIKWLSPREAFELITFPHISAMLKKTLENPEHVWTGTLLQYKEGQVWKGKIVEEFYPIH